jgi:hypothetical protein
MFPPQRQGGRELTIQVSLEGATAMMPMKQRDTSREVELDDFLRRRGEQVRQGAGAAVGIVDAIRHPMLEGEHAHFQHVAGFRLVDIDRSGEDVRAAAARTFDVLVDVDRILQHLVGGNAVAAKKGDGIDPCIHPAMRYRVDLHGLPRLDAERGRNVRGEIAPDHRLGRRAQCGIGLVVGWRRLGRRGACEPKHGPGEEPSQIRFKHTEFSSAGRMMAQAPRPAIRRSIPALMIALIAMQS